MNGSVQNPLSEYSSRNKPANGSGNDRVVEVTKFPLASPSATDGDAIATNMLKDQSLNPAQ
jgi:hypothetical protein